MPVRRIPRVLSIAGSDSGGGAGIQADLKAFAACGAHGMTAVTAITAQNTVGVTAVHAVPPDVIVAQVRAVAQDIGVDAVKIGMLGTVATIEAVAATLDLLETGTPVVLDPVMVSESGAELLDPSARGALVELLLPRATVVTPNLPEARALLGGHEDDVAAAGSRDPRSGAARGRDHRRSSGSRERCLLRRLAAGRDPRRPLSRRCRSRVGLHALIGAGGAAGVGGYAASGGTRGQAQGV